jgi:uncharacterized protein (TIGR02172 family)
LKTVIDSSSVTVFFKGRVDSVNAPEVERELFEIAENNKGRKPVLDFSELEYISSAGLRVLMKLKKKYETLELINVTPDIYEILSTTGFTEILTIHKKLKEISVSEENYIGAGANGKVYRLDDERIVKLYNPVSNPPEKIEREKAAARQAFVHGIPSAIPFDIVKIDGMLGMIYELINADTLGKYINMHPEDMEKYAVEMAQLLRQLHDTEFTENELPDARLGLKNWIKIAEDSGYYKQSDLDKVYDLVDSIPWRNTFIHGDFHPGNIMISDGEMFLIDMTDASIGHPVIDLLGAFQLMKLLPSKNSAFAPRYTGMKMEVSVGMWDIFIRNYLGTDDISKIAEVERTLSIYGLIRSLGGVTFSDGVPDNARIEQAAKIIYSILKGIEQGAAKIDFI